MLDDLHDMMAAWKADCRGRQRRKEGEGSVGPLGDREPRAREEAPESVQVASFGWNLKKEPSRFLDGLDSGCERKGRVKDVSMFSGGVNLFLGFPSGSAVKNPPTVQEMWI